MRLRRVDSPGKEVWNKCTGCYCHEFPIVFGDKATDYCIECGCPKTKETFDKLAVDIKE